MAVFKCKMCGGDLDVTEGMTIAECDYCGTKQTVPKAMDENLQNLFNRANTLRIKSEFDKAERIYEKIIQADSTQADAYWGLILCKYGIEYVDDPVTFKKIPTCHRASYEPIIADEDYKSALANADLSQRILYEEQAKEIDRIQKEILALAQKEETYDVFICYKETDASGQRTQDSVIANDIYYQLTNEGFKVFYAAITLEGKLGNAYEPIIFAALNSAKVMLTIGTKTEYFNAVWVKNEWSRFLKIIQKDRSKLLIPCYRDMDAYELPEEFAHLQAQDMSKIGFINDIVRGIKKVIKKDDGKIITGVNETIRQDVGNNIVSLLKRVNLFLESKEWVNANTYCDKILDIEPENAQAYIYKLLAEVQVSSEEALKFLYIPIEQLTPYKMAVRFADSETNKRLEQYSNIINDNIATQQEKERLVNELNTLEEKKECLSEKLSNIKIEYETLKEKGPKIKLFAKIILAWPIYIFVFIILGLLFIKIGVMELEWEDFPLIVGVGCFGAFAIMIFASGFLLKITNKSLIWVIVSVYTFSICSVVYAIISLRKCNSTFFSQYTEEIKTINLELQEIDNNIQQDKQLLAIIEEKIIELR